MPKSPVTINVVDVAGNLALTQDAIEEYAKKNPNLVAKFNFTKAPAPELPGKLKAMQGAGRSDIDLVLTGTDFLAAGIEQGLLIKLLPDYAAKFPEPDGELPAGGGEDAGARAGPGHRGRVHAGRPAARVQPGQGQAGADDAAGAARVVQGQSEPADLRAAGELRPGPHVHHGPAVHPRRQESEGSGQRLGQDLGVPEGAQLLHRVLPDRHRRGDEGAGRRLARHDA